MHSLTGNELIEQQWRTVLWLCYESFLDTNFDDGNPMVPKQNDLIKAYANKKSRQEVIEPIEIGREKEYSYNNLNNVQLNIQDEIPLLPQPKIPPSLLGQHRSKGNQASGGDNPPVQHADREMILKDIDLQVSTWPRGDNVGTYKDRPAKICRLPIDGENMNSPITKK